MKKSVSMLLTGILLLSLLSGASSVVAASYENKLFGDFTYNVIDEQVNIVDVDTNVSGDVVIPSSIEGYPVTGIGDLAFDGCDQMVTLKIPVNVAAIGETAFKECIALKAFIVSFGNKAYCTRGGVLYNKDRTVLLCYPPAKADVEFSIPDGVASVDDAAFGWSSKLERVTVADGVEKLGEKAFYSSTALKQITFGTGLTKIGAEAFSECAALESFTIPNSVTSVGVAAFSNCSALSAITFGRGITEIEGTMFLNCTNLKAVAIPENVKRIHTSAFSGCSNLETVTIPGCVTSIGAYTFHSCDNLKTVYFTGSQTDKSELKIGAKNEALHTAQWQYSAAAVKPPENDPSVGPQRISGPDSNIVWVWVMIGGFVALLTAVVAVLIVVLVKGIKART